MHKHSDDKFFEKILRSGKKPNGNCSNEKNGLTSDDQLTDNDLSAHEKLHSQSISNILRDYEISYRNKVIFQKFYRYVLFWGCSGLVGIFAIVIVMTLWYGVIHANVLELEGMATIIAGLISLLVAILQLIHTITKYCFPENDDEYILKIVDSIQKNDLERARIRHQNQGAKKGKKGYVPQADEEVQDEIPSPGQGSANESKDVSEQIESTETTDE